METHRLVTKIRKIMDKQQLGKNLKEIRLSSKVSHYKLNKDHGMVLHVISNMEKGTSNYTIDSLLKYLDAVGGEIKIVKKR